MAKEKKFNPVAAERKAQKAKEIKKGTSSSTCSVPFWWYHSSCSNVQHHPGKADLQARRNEKLAQRNPNRLKEQIATLKAIVESGGKLTQLEEQSLESLERDLKAIEKARKALGDKAPTFNNRGGGDGKVLGKRRREEDEVESDDSDVPEDVRRIPMPRDTPPPIPKPILDEWWAKRRAKRSKEQEQSGRGRGEGGGNGGGGGANAMPLGRDRGIGGGREETSTTPTPTPTTVAEPKVVYEAKPIVRDLRKEAVSAFVPTAVRMKMQKTQGVGGLMEPDEADRLEREGYLKTASGVPDAAAAGDAQRRTVTMEEVDDDED
jgi:hypothetical protein